MSRPLLWSTLVAGAASMCIAVYFDAVGLWWAGTVVAMVVGPVIGWYTRSISHRVAAFRAGWAAAGRRNKRVDGP